MIQVTRVSSNGRHCLAGTCNCRCCGAGLVVMVTHDLHVCEGDFAVCRSVKIVFFFLEEHSKDSFVSLIKRMLGGAPFLILLFFCVHRLWWLTSFLLIRRSLFVIDLFWP